jgi:transcriptional regulator with XRE-family HTH domain
MPTDAKLQQRRARTAHWLKLCRLTDQRDLTLAQVAVAAGLSEGSGSVVSLWERNVAAPKLDRLERLAPFYGVPLTLFTEPPETDRERLSRYRQLALGAVDAEQQDWDSEEGSDPSPGDEPGAAPQRQLA